MRQEGALRRRPAVVAAALVASGVSLLVVALLGARGSHLALGVGTALTGAWALVTGVVVLPRGLREGRPGRFRVVGALAGLCYGAGQLVLAGEQLRAGGAVPFPAVGDLISLGAVPLALVLLALMPRPGGTAGTLSRLAPDALVVAAAADLLTWRTVFHGTHGGFGASMAAAVALLVELLLVALLLQLAVVAFDLGPAVLGVGMTLLMTGDAATSWAALRDAVAADWVTVLGSAAAWPLIGAGLLITRATRGRVDSGAGAEARASLTTVSMIGLSATGVVVTAFDERIDPVSAVLLGVLVVGVVARELVLQRQRVAQVEALSRAADRDPLTGLANRRALAVAMDDLAAGSAPVGVVVLDLDGFKAVNDRLGHSTGDALIVAVAGVLAPLAAACDGVAARLGGDEFALVLPATAEAVDEVARSLAQAVHSCAGTVPGVSTVRVSASVGVVATTPAELRAGRDALAVVSWASAAMQEAKRTGRDRVVRYSGAVAAASSRRSSLERRLRSALLDGALDVHLQPVVATADGRLHGFEALVRWDDAELGPVAPAEFLPVAERTGLVVPLGRAVLRSALSALTELSELSEAGEESLGISVNASVVELRSPGYVDAVAAALVHAGVAARRLSLEVRQSAFAEDDDPALVALRELHELGVGVAVDDEGGGPASLSALAALPLTAFKLDRGLVADLGDARTRAVVAAVVALSASLGFLVVAEGVEHDEQRAVLAELGVPLAQGWLWAPALPRPQAALVALAGRVEPAGERSTTLR